MRAGHFSKCSDPPAQTWRPTNCRYVVCTRYAGCAGQLGIWNLCLHVSCRHSQRWRSSMTAPTCGRCDSRHLALSSSSTARHHCVKNCHTEARLHIMLQARHRSYLFHLYFSVHKRRKEQRTRPSGPACKHTDIQTASVRAAAGRTTPSGAGSAARRYKYTDTHTEHSAQLGAETWRVGL